MKRHVLAVCAMLALASGVAHAIPFDRIPLISNTLGDVQNRLCAGAATPAGQADIACPSYSPYVTSGGLLGVGTSSPTATLQVSGSFIISTTGQTSSPSLYVGTNGYVGIGLTNPLAPLQVNGNTDITTGHINVYSGDYFSGGGADISFYPSNGGIGAALKVKAATGNVGIGITAPSQTLHVSGTVLTTSWTGINFSSTGNVTPTAPLEVSGTISATHFVGDGSGLTGVTAASSDRITSGTTQMVVVSNTGFVSLTQASTNTGWFDPTRGLVTLGISTTGPISGTTGYFSGNVGIGTTNPSKTLHVAGTVLTTSWTGINFSSVGNVTPTAPLEVSGTISATHFVGDGSELTGVTAASSDRITSGSTQMVVVSNTGFVSLTQASTNTGWFDPTRGLVTLGVSATGPISGTNGYFSGNVGIGTTSPGYPLDVNGQIRVAAGSKTAPAIKFGSYNGGLYGRAGPMFAWSNGTYEMGYFDGNGLLQASSSAVTWSSSYPDLAGADTGLSRGAAPRKRNQV